MTDLPAEATVLARHSVGQVGPSLLSDGIEILENILVCEMLHVHQIDIKSESG